MRATMLTPPTTPAATSSTPRPGWPATGRLTTSPRVHAERAARGIVALAPPGSPREDDRRTQGRVRPRCRPDPPLPMASGSIQQSPPPPPPQLPGRPHRHPPTPLSQTHLRPCRAEHAHPALLTHHTRGPAAPYRAATSFASLRIRRPEPST